MFYVSCVQNLISQYVVVRTKDKIVAKRFKGYLFEECQARAERLVELLNKRYLRKIS